MSFNPRFGVGPFVSVPYGTVPVVPVVSATHYVVANPVIVSGPRLKKKPYYDTNDKAPSTTVFVGNIHEKANNDLMRSLLLKCGNIAQWKRVHGTNGRIQAFGFCEFDHPDATLRAVRLLNNLNLGGKKLLIKCDEKTQTTIKEYINKRRTIYGKAPLNLEKIEDIPVEEYFHDKDSSHFHRECRQLVATANEPDLLLEELPGDSKFPSNANLTSQLIIPETEEAEKDKLGLIEREIKQFRSTHKDEKIKSRHRRSSRSPPKKDTASTTNDAAKQETPTTTTTTEKENSRPPTTDAVVGRTSPVSSRASSKTRDRRTTANGKRSRSRETSRVVSKRRVTRSRSKSKTKRRDSEDEEDMRIRSRLERKIREKEYAYQERLQKWETRERKKKREYEKERHNEKQKRKEELREAKKLKEFFEDYDDDTEDPKYYKGKSYEIRRRDYDHEMELDARDRQKEREEMEEIRRRLLSEGVENPDVEILRMQRAQEERLLKRLRADSGSESPLLSSTAAASVATSPKSAAASRRQRRDSAASSAAETESIAGGGVAVVESTNTDQQMEAVVKSWQTMKEETTTTVDGPPSTPGSVGGQTSGQKVTSFGFAGLKISGRGPAHASSSSLLTGPAGGANVVADDDNDDDSSLTSKRQRPLVKLEYSDAEKQALEDQQPSLNVANMTVEEKRKAIKNLIEKIPTNREELFAYAINWPLVDQVLIEKRLKPWVNKKIVEYIGEEEPSLVDFICQKVAEKCPPQTILEDISMVLDEEASVFVIKLWRLLIYEIEAKRFGLVKLD